MSTIDLDLLKRLARTALTADDAYAYARLVPIIAANAPDESEWALGYLRALTLLHLSAAAIEVIDRLSAEMRRSPEVNALLSHVSSAPAARVPWSSRARRFEANLSALAQRDAATADAVRDAWRQRRDEYQMHVCQDGNAQIKLSDAAWPPRWLPFLEDHRGLAARRMLIPSTGLLPPPLLFDGCGLGWDVMEAYRRTSRVFLHASSAIYVVEPLPEALAIVLHVHDWRELIADPRVRLFIGEGCSDHLAEWLDADSDWPVAQRTYRFPLLERDIPPPPVSIMETVAQSRARRARALRERIARRYEARDSAYWSARFSRGATADGRATGHPLRIVGITSIHTTFLQYSMRDCLRALERLGHHTRLLIEPSPHQCLDAARVLKAQLDFEPDLILVLSRMRDEMTGLAHPSIPSVSWDQDSLPWVFDAARDPQLAWNDFLMGYAASTAPTRFGWPEHRCMFCSLAGSLDTYDPTPLPDAELEPFSCDVSYVSHASATVEDETAAVEGWLPDPSLRGVFRAALERLLPAWRAGEDFPGPVMSAVIDACDAAGMAPDAGQLKAIGQAVGRIGDRVFRHVALGWVADWADRTGRTFHLWGNGWEHHPRLARYARGATTNGHQLRCVYQASRINLQLMAFGFLHQRALDGLMAGAFFMARRTTADTTGPLVRDLTRRLDQYAITTPSDLAAVRSEADRRAIESAMIRLGRDPRLVTPECVEVYRLNARCDFAAEVVPHFDAVTFGCAAEFEAKAEPFLADLATRRRCASDMRRAIADRYSYDTRMAHMVRFVREGFSAQAAPEGRAVRCDDQPAPVP